MLVGSPCRAARRCLLDRKDEMLPERLLLLLVLRPDLLAVEDRRLLEHALKSELADSLAVLDHEGNLMGPDLQRRSGPP